MQMTVYQPRASASPAGQAANALAGELWDLATGMELRTFTGHTVISVAISPDGRTALSGSSDHTLKLWNLTPCLPASVSRKLTKRLSKVLQSAMRAF